MSHTQQTPSADDPDARAAELRDLAGPVHGEGATAADAGRADDATHGDATDGPLIDDSPDARTNPDIDEVRADTGDDAAGDLEDQYQLRSMGAQPNPTEGDPGSYLNF